ncbi:MAG: hypothetical protein ACREMO_11805 [Gemmatimonadales bacterium]
MYVRLREAKRLSRAGYRLTLDVVDPEREAWDLGDCVVQIDLQDEPSHSATPRGLLKPAFELYQLSRKEPPTSSESRLLWEIGHTVDHYVDRLFSAGVVCPVSPRAKDEAPERSDDSHD